MHINAKLLYRFIYMRTKRNRTLYFQLYRKKHGQDLTEYDKAYYIANRMKIRVQQQEYYNRRKRVC